ncbi:MAG: radical SAM protein, partial [Acidimicrobiia bacterium]|nr:radical SAM protein [Acidimicrobiia bacterium]
MAVPSFLQVDVEATNRCNARCYFCPRDKTPHQGLMSADVFARTLDRVDELHELSQRTVRLPVHVALCGLGEPLLNPRLVEMVAAVAERGYYVSVSTNAALLDERRAAALLDAGLDEVAINVGEADEDYEDVYKLPYQRTHDNVVRFVQMAAGRCKVQVVLVDHRGDGVHMGEMRRYWMERGVEHFLPFPLINRGGALEVDSMNYASYPEQAQAAALLGGSEGEPVVCGFPFLSMFVGYDGNHYLCCSDWKKEVPLGSIFDWSFADVLRAKYEHTAQRASVCSTCTIDPLNYVTGEIRAVDQGAANARGVDVAVRQMRGFEAPRHGAGGGGGGPRGGGGAPARGRGT